MSEEVVKSPVSRAPQGGIPTEDDMVIVRLPRGIAEQSLADVQKALERRQQLLAELDGDEWEDRGAETVYRAQLTVNIEKWTNLCGFLQDALSGAAPRETPGEPEKPVAWAIFAENGNIRLWSTRPQTANEEGALPLYLHPRSPSEDQR